MDNAELYSKYNSMQKQDTVAIMKEFGPKLSWSSEETVLDVGCGPGDVTVDVLLPYLPPNASLVGIDICSKMVDYANMKYSNDKVKFKALDFSTKIITSVFPEKSFSKLLSFYCLHWIQDQQQVANNIFSLLRPSGEFLVVMSLNRNVFMIYQILSQMDKWKDYMMDLDNFKPFFYELKNPKKYVEDVWNSQRLEVIKCEERIQNVTFPNKNVLMKSKEAVNPFLKRMSQHTQDEFMAAYEQIIDDHQLTTETETGEIIIKQEIIIIYGRRPHNDFSSQ